MTKTVHPRGVCSLLATLALLAAIVLATEPLLAAESSAAKFDTARLESGVGLPRPLFARPATTAQSFYMDAFIEYFDGLPLQEAVDLEGWTAGLDFTLPFRPGMQIRLLLPVRTEADATLVDGGDDISIEGWGGTFRFATVFFEHQVVGLDAGPNRLSYFLGYGNRTAVLNTGTPDRYNHDGRSLHGGLRYDRLLGSGGRLILDGEIRSYEASDDLNPASLTDDRFLLFTFNAAWIGAQRGIVTPALELTTNTIGNFVAASLVPEVILHASDALEFKFGIPLGLTAEAPDWGAQFRLSATL
jgi:hypothetical protein